ncbi:uncharacterized protein [Drosophila kikkawai]|uniref:Uncharacterized protein n=1 Tax=Drosophila kikkawai TaxID=30033 RepID=A0ABM4GBA8_DROKI|nr:uncharacterized protein LOC108071980 [Drosophila kikkawai]
MSQESIDCDEQFQRPKKTLVLTIFALAVLMKLCIILVEVHDFGNYLQGEEKQKYNN